MELLSHSQVSELHCPGERWIGPVAQQVAEFGQQSCTMCGRGSPWSLDVPQKVLGKPLLQFTKANKMMKNEKRRLLS